LLELADRQNELDHELRLGRIGVIHEAVELVE
jgi:hypothetical protein